ncbi:aminotransferase class I/II-fold pyridoxal phosphate-dependent enzyme [Vampirovibrio chlorellavorus]|uniref:aminotransferase class I/II-fold pyridoxal phosphate-dependent enzyme n=1 Tax=Vampirovibrio chlorellavorus TaxID=758823 RepID=UPI0026EDCCCF|nr:aminotransferase class I/II-fold pyridoxal phosphate-dependent enzyme [Vampirovibrio chlorellavorus]
MSATFLAASTSSSASHIPLSEPTLETNAWTYVKDALDSGWVSSVGPYVDRFERAFADYFQVPRTVATVNGTAALHIALLLAGVQPGDEVIVPSLTFIASINVIRYIGAIPVFWDSQSDHWNADPALLHGLITPKTKAIMAVHLYGDAMDMGPILALAEAYNLKVIEDAAEALGADWNGQPCGAIGDVGCLSFNGNKTLTTGGGGLIVSKHADLLSRAHYLINQAKDDGLTFTHNEVGYNYRLTNLQAALGVAQLECLPRFLENRRRIWQRYQAAFAGHPQLTLFEALPNTTRSAWLYGVAINPQTLPDMEAMDMVNALSQRQIQSRPFFKPGHQQKPFQPFVSDSLPNADRWHQLGFNLPSSSSLSPADQERVIEAVLDILNHRKTQS